MGKEFDGLYLINNNKLIAQIDEIQDSNLKYEYNTKYKPRRFDKYDGSVCVDISKPTDYQKIYEVFSVDESKIPDKYDIQISKLIPCRWHKKRRINKKMMKKHGHSNYVHRFETSKGWKVNTYTNGEFEFVKDGDINCKVCRIDYKR